MKRCWVIAPYYSGEASIFEKAWEYDFKNGTIAVGWEQLGNIIDLNLSKDEYKKRYDGSFRNGSSYDRESFWRFCHEISIGDRIIARRGRKAMLAVGEVISKPYYDQEKGRDRLGPSAKHYYSNFINVKWEKKEVQFENIVFPMFTIWEVPEEKFNKFMGGTPLSEDTVTVSTEEQEFILERYLEDFIVSNFSKIFGNKLTIYESEEGNGQQYTTDVGNIDILARETKSNAYVVIELKKGRESDKVVGQILRYMGWIKENLATEGESVKGIIICKGKDDKLEYSLKAIPGIDIELKLYKIDFQLTPYQAG